jgi:hypothetical protein
MGCEGCKTMYPEQNFVFSSDLHSDSPDSAPNLLIRALLEAQDANGHFSGNVIFMKYSVMCWTAECGCE